MKQLFSMPSRLELSKILVGSSALLLASCTTITTFGSSDDTGGGSDSSGEFLSSGSGDADVTRGDSSSSSTMGASSSDGSDSSEAEGSSFIEDDDWPDPCGDALPDGVLAHSTYSCSVLRQDCCPGDACRAWANDGGSSWNSTRCSPVDRDAGQAGDPCIAESSGVSGIDSCDIGLMCWEVDPDSLQGTCIEYCSGSAQEPVCSSPDDVCRIMNDGVLALCLPSCDPLLNDCGVQEACVPLDEESFACIAEQYLACPAGTIGVQPPVIAGCTEEEPCCAAYCDTSDEASCGRGLECMPFFEDPNPAYPSLGLCVSAR